MCNGKKKCVDETWEHLPLSSSLVMLGTHALVWQDYLCFLQDVEPSS